MARKKKVRVDRVIILILIGILILGVLGFGAYKILSYIANKNNENKVLPHNNVETTSGVKVSVDDYTVYVDNTNKMGFNFIIATLKFEADTPVSFDLNNLQTSEKIYLNDVTKYLHKLEDGAYNLSKLNYVSMVAADEKAVTCNVFIPYTTNQNSLSVYNASDATKLEFKLDHNLKYFSSLKLGSEEEIKIEDDKNQVVVKVSKSYISTMMLHNDEEYDASAYNVYTFEINVTNVNGKVMITDAKFIKADSSEEIECLNHEYKSVKAENALGKKLEVGDNGALFFEVPAKDNIDYTGQLLLMFSNSNEWVAISTELE